MGRVKMLKEEKELRKWSKHNGDKPLYMHPSYCVTEYYKDIRNLIRAVREDNKVFIVEASDAKGRLSELQKVAWEHIKIKGEPDYFEGGPLLVMLIELRRRATEGK